jgi:hypothetical protein
MQDQSRRLGEWLAPHVSRHRARMRASPLALAAALLAVVVSGSAVLFPPLLAKGPTFVTETRPGPTIVGYLTFSNSGQLDPLSRIGLNDIVTLDVRNLAPIAADKSYEAWLLPDRTSHGVAPLLLGTLLMTRGNAHLVYRAPTHADLLAGYSGVCVLAQPTGAPHVPVAADLPASRYGGRIASTPTPGDEQGYSLLSHLRHLLARDPDLVEIGLGGGLSIWLVRNGGKLWEWASAARDAWAGGATDYIHRQIVRILEYLDGEAFAWRDLPSGTPWLVDPQAGRIGLLPVEPDQAPPAYLTHIASHLEGVAYAPGHTEAEQRLADQIDAALSQVTVELTQTRQDARRLVTMNTSQLKQPQTLALLDELTLHASLAYAGQFRPQEGNVGGILWIASVLQQLAMLPIEAAPGACS